MTVVNYKTFSKQEVTARQIKKNTHVLQHKTIELNRPNMKLFAL